MDDFRVKCVPFETKAVNPDERTIEGYAAAFLNVDSWGDRLMPGCFAKTIKENLPRIKVAWQHDFWDLIGKPIELREDDVGLFTRSYISRVQRGDEALVLAKDGVITEMSVGFYLVPKKYEDNDFGGFDIYELKLMEYSLVTWAANPLAKITAVKSAEVARLLRGLDNTDPEAVSAASAALKALLGTDPQPPLAAAAPAGEPGTAHSFATAVEALTRSAIALKEIATDD